ncbi:MAG: hypothetical protein KF743_12290 [Fimbriimonadaceae bacterium]|nr:hypothetical protein [Fimbriimonadaceae bacterium]
MGADLYLRSNYDRLQQQHQRGFELAVAKRDKAKTSSEHDQAQREVSRLFDLTHSPECYHRDPYNKWGLLAQLGLSWWRDVAPRLEEDDSLPLDDVSWLLGEVRSRRLTCQPEPTEEQSMAAEVMAQVSGQKHTSTRAETLQTYSAEDVQWFVSRKAALIRFLETALELGEKPVCSL